MYCTVKGRCVHHGEVRKVEVAGKPAKTVHEFGFMVEAPKGMPEIIKVVSWNGFNPKLGDVAEFQARVSLRTYRDKSGRDRADLAVEVL